SPSASSTAPPAPTAAAGAAAPATSAPAQMTGLKYLSNAPNLSLSPKAGGKGVMTFIANPPNLDPLTSSSFATVSAIVPIYSHLIRLEYGVEMKPYNAFKFNLAPDLAQTWQFNADYTELTLKLAPGVKW